MEQRRHGTHLLLSPSEPRIRRAAKKKSCEKAALMASQGPGPGYNGRYRPTFAAATKKCWVTRNHSASQPIAIGATLMHNCPMAPTTNRQRLFALLSQIKPPNLLVRDADWMPLCSVPLIAARDSPARDSPTMAEAVDGRETIGDVDGRRGPPSEAPTPIGSLSASTCHRPHDDPHEIGRMA